MERLIPHSEIINPSKTGLLVVDYQNEYTTPGFGYYDFVKQTATNEDFDHYLKAITNIPGMVELARAASLPLIFLQFIQDKGDFRPKYLIDREKRLGWQSNILKPHSSDLGISPRENEHTVVKHSFDGFENTNLDETLHGLGIDNLIVAGLTTELCVYHTMVTATTKFGLRCIAIEDAMAARLKSWHDSFLSVFSRNFGETYTTSEVRDIMQERKI